MSTEATGPAESSEPAGPQEHEADEEPFVVEAFGASWTLRTSGLDEPLASRMRELWTRAKSPAAVGAPPPPAFELDRRDSALVVQGEVHEADDVAAAYAVSRALTLASIGRRTGECLMLHAAGLCSEDGATVALVAPSGTGKTTAATVLGRTLGYVSDETVGVEEDLRVRPYAKPLSIVHDPDQPYDKQEWSPDELGLTTAPPELHLVGVVVLDRRDEPTDARLEPIGLVEAAGDVLAQTSATLALADPLDRLARVLTAGGGPWRLVYRDIADGVDLVTSVVVASAPPEPTITWSTEAGTDSSERASGPEHTPDVDISGATVLCRGPWAHALHAEGNTLVMVGSVPMTLPGLASAVWRMSEEPVSFADLRTAVVAELGDHPQAAEVLRETVRRLADAGLVSLSPTT